MGGANSAGQAALFFSRYARKVTLLVRATALEDGQERELETAAMFIFIGATPRTELASSLVELDERGFVLTGPDLPRDERGPRGWQLERDPYLFETSVPGIFAVGDVRAGSGKRVATAVGEGSAALSMVHSYLETV